MDKIKIYNMCLTSSRLIARNYEDLAHDVFIKLTTSGTLEKLESIHKNQLAYYVYKACKTEYLDQLRQNKECELLIDPELIEDEHSEPFDPYKYIQRIREELSEIERLWIEEYIDSEGNASLIAKKLKIARQTVSKRVKASCKKLK